MGWIGAAVSGAGSILSGIGSNRKIAQMQKDLEQRKNQNQDWFDRRYNESAMERSGAQQLWNLTQQAIKDSNSRAAGTAAVMGMNNNFIASQKQPDTLSKTAAEIAVQHDRDKANIEGAYMKQRDALDDKIMDLKNKKKDWTQIGGEAVGAAFDGFTSSPI